MAARTKYLFHPDEARKRIQGTMLIKRLYEHAISPANEPLMSKTQIEAANILLKKCFPDLSAVTISGDADNPIETFTEIHLVAPSIARIGK